MSPSATSPSDDVFGSWFQTIGTNDPDGRALFVGSLDGPAFEVLWTDGAVRATGPRNGQVLVVWTSDGDSIIESVDTGTGERREILRSDELIVAASFGLEDDCYYVTEIPGDGFVGGVFRLPLSGGQAQRVADGWSGSLPYLYPSVDGRTIAIATVTDGSVRSYRLLDVRERAVQLIPRASYNDVVGVLGDELVVWEDAPRDALELPLRAISSDGSSRRIADQDGFAAAIYATSDRSPALVFEGHDQVGHHTLSTLTPGASSGKVVYVGNQNWFDPPVQMVWRTQWMGIDVPGYVPVFPAAQVFLPESYRAEFGDLPRMLVSLEGGPPVTLGRQPVATLKGVMAAVCPVDVGTPPAVEPSGLDAVVRGAQRPQVGWIIGPAEGLGSDVVDLGRSDPAPGRRCGDHPLAIRMEPELSFPTPTPCRAVPALRRRTTATRQASPVASRDAEAAWARVRGHRADGIERPAGHR